MSDEFSIAGNFKTGKIGAAEYDRKMARLQSVDVVSLEADAEDSLPILARARMLSDGTMFTIHYWPDRRACLGSTDGGQEA